MLIKDEPMTSTLVPRSPLATPRNIAKIDVDPATLVLLNKLTEVQRRNLALFVSASRSLDKEKVDDLTGPQWTAQCAGLLSKTPLTQNERKQVVVALYRDVSSAPQSNLRTEFNIDGAFDFVWDNEERKYGVTLKKKGFLSWMSCCSSATVEYDANLQKLDVDIVRVGEEAVSPVAARVTSSPVIAYVAPPVSDASTSACNSPAVLSRATSPVTSNGSSSPLAATEAQ
jgi:hypothetical protein